MSYSPEKLKTSTLTFYFALGISHTCRNRIVYFSSHHFSEGPYKFERKSRRGFNGEKFQSFSSNARWLWSWALNLTLNFDTFVKNVLMPFSYIITCRLNSCPQLNHLEKNGPHHLQTNLIQPTKPLGKCSKRVKCSLGQVCVCRGQTNKLIGLWKVLAYFPQI